MRRRTLAIRTEKSSTSLSRRTFLRGAVGGATLSLALPPLEAMMNGNGTAHADGTALPKRYVTWFWGNGVVPDQWVPATTGAGYLLSPALQAFANVKDYLNVVTGMNMSPSRAHLDSHSLILTGANGSAGDFNTSKPTAASIDYRMGQFLGKGSTVVGVARYSHGDRLLQDNISSSGTVVREAVDDPATLFNEIFGNGIPKNMPGGGGPGPSDLARAKILDAVNADAQALKARLGTRDQNRVDGHLQAISELQASIRMTSSNTVSAECKLPTIGDSRTLTNKTNVMNEIIRMAFACDLRRSIAYKWSGPASHAPIPDIGINESFHKIGHATLHRPPSLRYADYKKGIEYIMQRFASFLTALKNTPEGAQNLLFNSVVFGTSCIAYQQGTGDTPGNFAHFGNGYPVILAGAAGGTLKTGLHLAVSGDNVTKVPLTIFQALGAPMTSWGAGNNSANQPLSGLLA